MEEKDAFSKDRFAGIFPGLGIGLLLGVVMGLSVSPVVATVLGALTTLLGALLGLQGSESGTEAASAENALKAFHRRKVNGLRIGSFGFACVAGIFLGLFMRSHEFLSVPIKQLVHNYEGAGYDHNQALELAAYQKLGLLPLGRQVQVAELQKGLSSNLFTGLAKIDFCREVSLDRYGGDVKQVLLAYRRQNDDKLTRLAGELESLPAVQERKDLIKAVEEVLCEYHTQIHGGGSAK